MANGEPMAIEATHLSARRFPRLRQHLARIGSLYTALSEVYGVHLATAEQSIETVLAGPHEAAALQTDVGVPLLMLARHSFDDAGEPVEWVRSVYRGDRYRFVTWLHRPGESANGVVAGHPELLLSTTPVAPAAGRAR
jgi:GntR family transcriptional regulator